MQEIVVDGGATLRVFLLPAQQYTEIKEQIFLKIEKENTNEYSKDCKLQHAPSARNLLQTKQIGHCIPVVLFLLVHDMQQYF